MLIKRETYKILDFDFVLDKLIVHSPYGEQRKKALMPYDASSSVSIEALKEDYALQKQCLDYIERYRYDILSLRSEMDHLKDLRGSLGRIVEAETLTLTELFEIKGFVLQLKKIAQIQSGVKPKFPDVLEVKSVPEVEKLLDPEKTGTATFYLYDAYSAPLKETRIRLKSVEEKLQILKKTCREAIEETLGVKVRGAGDVQVVKHDQQLIQKLESHNALKYASENAMYRLYQIDYGDAGRILEEEILGLKNEEERLEGIVCEELTQALEPFAEVFEDAMNTLGLLDLTLAKSYFSLGYKCVEPQIINSESQQMHLNIEEGRYIKAENHLRASGKHYIPVSVNLRSGVTCITGANMGGKTLSLKMIGQLVLMAQCGLYVPAKAMSFTPLSFIACSIGDEQNVDKGLSTFGAEIYSIKNAIDLTDHGGLLLIDELARGTNPREGHALSKAIIDYLQPKPAMTCITTHFDGLADAPEVHHLQVVGLKTDDLEALLKDTSRGALDVLNDFMDYRLRVVETPEAIPKDAITISEILGLHTDILNAARRIVTESITTERSVERIGGEDAK